MEQMKSELRYEDIIPLNAGHGVYLVRNADTGRICVKKIQQTYNLDVYKRVRESKIRGIPEIYDIYEDNGTLIVIEEFVSGETIEDILKRKGAMSEEAVRDITIRLCGILNELHSLLPPVVHRDIKPSNVMLTSYGEVFLIDLNAAKLEDTKKDEDTILLGTYGYAAPEQYGFGTSTIQTDIYALGMLMNTMLKGQYSKEVPDSGSMAETIKRCVMLNPGDRYGSVNELRRALESPGSSSRRRFLPPGFRSGNPMHMIVSIVGYIGIFAFCLTFTSNNPNSFFVIWHERFFLLAIVLMIVFFSSDYLGIQKKIPLCRSNRLIIRIIGIILFDALIFLGMVCIMIFFEMLLLKAVGL